MTVARSSVGWARRSSVSSSKYSSNWAIVRVRNVIGSPKSPKYSGSAAPNTPWVSSSIRRSSLLGHPEDAHDHPAACTGTAMSCAKSHVAAEVDQLVDELVGDRVDRRLQRLHRGGLEPVVGDVAADRGARSPSTWTSVLGLDAERVDELEVARRGRARSSGCSRRGRCAATPRTRRRGGSARRTACTPPPRPAAPARPGAAPRRPRASAPGRRRPGGRRRCGPARR